MTKRRVKAYHTSWKRSTKVQRKKERFSFEKSQHQQILTRQQVAKSTHEWHTAYVLYENNNIIPHIFIQLYVVSTYVLPLLPVPGPQPDCLPPVHRDNLIVVRIGKKACPIDNN